MRQLEFNFSNGSNSFQDLLHSLFIYKKGRLFYRVTPGRHGGVSRKNVEAGWKDKSGYRKIEIKGKAYWVHHLVFIMHHGDSVLEKLKNGLKIDHKDNNKRNNKIENLRLSTSAENARNRKANKKRKLPKGISLNGRGFIARLKFEGKLFHKTFLSIDEAVSWRNWIGQKIHGEFFRGD